MASSERLSQQQLIATLPLHGGDLPWAEKHYGIALDQWIDLSTGINPEPYPVPAIPSPVFNHLPYWQADFLAAAREYYQQHELLAVAGTQSVIQRLPNILNQHKTLDVLVPDVGYQEHARQWRVNNRLHRYRAESAQHMCADIDARIAGNPQQHIVMIRPNNPTAVMTDIDQLLQWSRSLAEHAYLIVDEAFIDTRAEQSLLTVDKLPDNVIVLRSFGKFFGLAGIRLGFVFANAALLQALIASIGIWHVNGPAQYVAARALSDRRWQRDALRRALSNARQTEALFRPVVERFALLAPFRHELFLSYPMRLAHALALYHHLAQAGVMTRVIVLNTERALLRVGCLAQSDTAAVNRIERVLHRLCKLDSLDGLLR